MKFTHVTIIAGIALTAALGAAVKNHFFSAKAVHQKEIALMKTDNSSDLALAIGRCAAVQVALGNYMDVDGYINVQAERFYVYAQGAHTYATIDESAYTLINAPKNTIRWMELIAILKPECTKVENAHKTYPELVR